VRSRGRPPNIASVRPYPNRLGDLRRRLGLSQRKVARCAGISVAYYGALERGDKRINADTARQLQRPLRCAVGDLLAGAGVSVPLLFAIAAAESEGQPAQYDLPEPHEWLQPGRLSDAGDCFAAEILDDGGDLDFPEGSLLVARSLTAPAGVALGSKIIARFFLEPFGDRATHEILYGILDQNIVGDLVLITRTRNRALPRHLVIRSAPPLERAPTLLPRDGIVEYSPGTDDPAEILGIVVYAMGPV